jgi:hypothetical protein
MRRILLVLTVAALMAAMMVTAGPAKADVDVDVDVDVGGGSGIDDVGEGFFGFDDVGDRFGFGLVDGFGFDLGDDDDDDDDDEDDINSSFFVSQVDGEFDNFEPGGIALS